MMTLSSQITLESRPSRVPNRKCERGCTARYIARVVLTITKHEFLRVAGELRRRSACALVETR